MKKLLNLLLILTFHLGYLEWGKGNSSFIFQAEVQIFSKAKVGFQNALHPVIMIPAIGIILLLYTLFQAETNRSLTLVGVACLGLLIMILRIIGIIDANFKILLSTIPFWTVAMLVICRIRKGTRVRMQIETFQTIIANKKIYKNEKSNWNRGYFLQM